MVQSDERDFPYCTGRAFSSSDCSTNAGKPARPTVMILTCSQCATRYHVDPESLGSDGRAVRCAGCGHRWPAKPPADAPKVVELKPPSPSPRPAGRRPRSPRRAAARSGSSRLLGGAFVILVVASAAIGRYEIVACFPATAPIYRSLWLPVTDEPAGLEFEDVTSERLVEERRLGAAWSRARSSTSPSRRAACRRSASPCWTAAGAQLQHEILNSKDSRSMPAARPRFSGRLVNPPSQARNFSITFDVDS